MSSGFYECIVGILCWVYAGIALFSPSGNIESSITFFVLGDLAFSIAKLQQSP